MSKDFLRRSFRFLTSLGLLNLCLQGLLHYQSQLLISWSKMDLHSSLMMNQFERLLIFSSSIDLSGLCLQLTERIENNSLEVVRKNLTNFLESAHLNSCSLWFHHLRADYCSLIELELLSSGHILQFYFSISISS
jgi:hypothetical protein